MMRALPASSATASGTSVMTGCASSDAATTPTSASRSTNCSTPIVRQAVHLSKGTLCLPPMAADRELAKLERLIRQQRNVMAPDYVLGTYKYWAKIEALQRVLQAKGIVSWSEVDAAMVPLIQHMQRDFSARSVRTPVAGTAARRTERSRLGSRARGDTRSSGSRGRTVGRRPPARV
jgi:hypothetical protein